MLSSTTLELLKKAETLALDDPGDCKVEQLREEGDFIRAVLTLSHSQCVAITAGFPCNIGYEQQEETDGPPGAMAIIQALTALGKKVVWLCDTSNIELFEGCIKKMMADHILEGPVEVLSYPELVKQKRQNEFDCLVSIERCGRTKAGTFGSCSGLDLTQYLDPVDDLFLEAQKNPGIATIGIGDRGNELGLGKVYEKVEKFVKNGSSFGCVTPADFVVMAGVSNWGGYAIAAALHLLTACPVHRRYKQHGIAVDKPLEVLKKHHFLPTENEVSVCVCVCVDWFHWSLFFRQGLL